MDLHDYARRMPKAELHVHLEGTVGPATLLELARRNGVRLPSEDEAGLQQLYRFHDFRRLIQVFRLINSCLRTQDDYRLIAYAYGRECARQNIRYAEVTFSIETNTRKSGLSWLSILEALNAGREAAHLESGVELRWIFDIVRDHPKTQDQVLEIALAAREQGCLALGLGGSEKRYPPRLFERAFERARQAGLPRAPHAGEMAGPSSVWGALDLLHADRLAHGVRSAEDPSLVEVLSQRQIALDVCPTSNIRLGVYPTYADHPLRRLWEAGALITVGSDDPPLFNTDLIQEYQVLIDHFGFQAVELEQVSLNGLRASFLPPEGKARLLAEFQAEFMRLREA
jgi:adenosine deaminase